ncbi:GreA/GreB family elongation factor [Hydrogenophaga sp. SL48]|jgi:regulator of nucleoside diphosphate kinase|uniref:GreA/GreB family elongation factor n=1 Tax=Hydrogenophaga sp. SL48 TaxID=2806347 RepID=UPI001F022811|nr:GreA/GreB family elongation factor [Hydrogenophaga sp. SL48]UJW83324.1 GreA/GreB family elongation factor [Hydrogenophaga sp. SL48]
MHKNHAGERLLTEIDFARLSNLRGAQLPPELLDTLESLDLVPSREIPPDIITMYSQVIVEDLESKKRQKLTLCYPADAEPHQGFISVLSPVGASLLGQREGAIARWRTPNGEACAARILTLLFQPEASGDYTT